MVQRMLQGSIIIAINIRDTAVRALHTVLWHLEARPGQNSNLALLCPRSFKRCPLDLESAQFRVLP